MKLTAKALRLVSALSMSLADSDARVRLTKWLQRYPEDDMPKEIAALVLVVLTNGARRLESMLDSGRLSEDEEADALNDLGYLQSVGAAIKMGIGNAGQAGAQQDRRTAP